MPRTGVHISHVPPPFGKLNLWIQPSLHIDAHTPRIPKRLVLLLHVDVPVFVNDPTTCTFCSYSYEAKRLFAPTFKSFSLMSVKRVIPSYGPRSCSLRSSSSSSCLDFPSFVVVLFLRYRRLRRRGNDSNRLLGSFVIIIIIIIIIIIFNNFVFVVVVRGNKSFILRNW